jgi:hypothetical protein
VVLLAGEGDIRYGVTLGCDDVHRVGANNGAEATKQGSIKVSAVNNQCNNSMDPIELLHSLAEVIMCNHRCRELAVIEMLASFTLQKVPLFSGCSGIPLGMLHVSRILWRICLNAHSAAIAPALTLCLSQPSSSPSASSFSATSHNRHTCQGRSSLHSSSHFRFLHTGSVDILATLLSLSFFFLP